MCIPPDLQREPEDEAAIAFHQKFPDLFSLGRHLTSSAEFGLIRPSSVPDHHIYAGYDQTELAIFREFDLYDGPGLENFVINFLGARTRCSLQAPLIPFSGQVEGYPEPVGSTQGETAEWLGTLRSVLEAKSSFRLLELGAGYGPWMAITRTAARQRGITDIRVYGVEGDAHHVDYIRTNMADNGIVEGEYVAIHAAVGTTDGTAYWPVEDDASAVYGARPVGKSGDDYLGNKGRDVVEIPVAGINRLLDDEPFWDLVHIDIQGHESEVCSAGIEKMNHRVRRVVVGTHSRALDGAILSIFHRNGWLLENEKPTISTWNPALPNLEAMTAVDGVQVWRNPRI